MKGRRIPLPSVIRLEARTLTAAQAEAAQLGLTGIWIVQVLHDDGCKACTSHRDADCRPPCAPDFVLMRIDAYQSFAAFAQTMRKAGLN